MNIEIPSQQEINEMPVGDLINWASKLVSVHGSVIETIAGVRNRLTNVNAYNIGLENTLDQFLNW